MRMMKNNDNETVMVIGIDHGYGNMKTATRCFPSGVARYDKEPIFQNNLLVYNGMCYQIGEEHKEFCAEKTQDEDYYVLTLAAIARELDGKGMNRAKVQIAAGLPLTWVATQKEDFQKYLLQNECVDFTFRNKEYHVEFAGADIYPQGFAGSLLPLTGFQRNQHACGYWKRNYEHYVYQQFPSIREEMLYREIWNASVCACCKGIPAERTGNSGGRSGD